MGNCQLPTSKPNLEYYDIKTDNIYAHSHIHGQKMWTV